MTRSTATCRSAGRWPSGARSAPAIRRRSKRRRAASMREHVEAMVAFWNAGVPTLDYGNNIRQVAKEEGLENAFAFPGLRAGLYPSAVLPRHRPVPLGGPLRRSGGHLQDRRQGEGTDAGQQASAQLAGHGPRAHLLPGPAGAHLLGRSRRSPPPRPRLQRDGHERRAEGAGRHRPRPSRLRLGRLAEPRDRSHEGRLGRRFRLAAAQRAAQHRVRRDLGVAASRRRRRHGLLAAFRHGHRRATARRMRPAAWSACCGTIRRPASCAMPMPATTSRSTARASIS